MKNFTKKRKLEDSDQNDDEQEIELSQEHSKKKQASFDLLALNKALLTENDIDYSDEDDDENDVKNNELHKAIIEDNIFKIKKLLQKKPQLLNIPNSKGNTPFHTAILREETEIAQLILDALDANNPLILQNERGNTCLVEAVIADFSSDFIEKLIIKEPLALNIPDEYGFTPLSLTIVEHNPRIANVLIRYGAPTNIKNKKGQTLDDLAIEQEYSSFSHFLNTPQQNVQPITFYAPSFNFPTSFASIPTINPNTHSHSNTFSEIESSVPNSMPPLLESSGDLKIDFTPISFKKTQK